MAGRLDGYRGPQGDRSDPFEEQDGSVPWPEGKPVSDWDSKHTTDPEKRQRIKQLEDDNGEALY